MAAEFVNLTQGVIVSKRDKRRKRKKIREREIANQAAGVVAAEKSRVRERKEAFELSCTTEPGIGNIDETPAEESSVPS